MAAEKETTLEEAFAELDGMLEKLADRDVPDYILDELLVALQSYQSQEIMLNMQSTPRSQTAPAAMKRRQARSQWPGTYQPFNSGKNDF